MADMVLEEAQKLWNERTSAILKSIEVAVHNGVASGMGGGS